MRPFAIAFVGLVLGQPGNVLNGNWTANFQGTTYVRLAFAEGATVPQGTMSIGQRIHVDDEGNVDRFEFRLIVANHAELAPILSGEERRQLAAEQIPLPKPFRLTKAP